MPDAEELIDPEGAPRPVALFPDWYADLVCAASPTAWVRWIAESTGFSVAAITAVGVVLLGMGSAIAIPRGGGARSSVRLRTESRRQQIAAARAAAVKAAHSEVSR